MFFAALRRCAAERGLGRRFFICEAAIAARAIVNYTFTLSSDNGLAMNKTKRRILDVSLELFNQHGIANVSQRKITTTLQISPGNLTYHFKKKEELYEVLYFEFIHFIEEEVKQFLKEEINLKGTFQLMKRWFDLMYQYRFIFVDVTNLMQQSQEVMDNYQQFVEVRKSVFLKIITTLEEAKILRKEELTNEYLDLYHRLHIISDFYLSSVSIFATAISQEQKEAHQRLFFQAMYPYFTKKGKKQYMELL